MRTRNLFSAIIPAIFVIFFSMNAFTQENFLPGYVVTNKGDTIRGFVDYRDWDKNPDNVGFKESEAGKKWSYSPRLIKAFGVKDEAYESAVIDVETSPFQIQELSYEAKPTLKKDSIFLQAVVKGPKSLFYYKMKTGRELFYIWKDGAFDLLLYKKYLKEDADRTVIVENKTWAGQLNIYLNDCPSIMEKLNQTTYRKSSLGDLFMAYYKCKNTDAGFRKKTEKTKVSFGVIAGVSITSLKFKGTDFPYLIKTDYDLSVNFSVGGFFEIILPRAQGKWSVNNELIWSSYETAGSYAWNDPYHTITYTKVGMGYIKLNNMVRYKIAVGKVYPYLNLGFSNGVAITQTNQASQESSSILYQVANAKALNETRGWEFGLIAGAGVMYKKFSFEARYERGNGMSTYISLKSVTNRGYLFLGYRF